MPAEMMTDANGIEYIGYNPISKEESLTKVRELYKSISKIASLNGIRPGNLLFDWATIAKIIERIEQKSEYFKIYHKNTKLNEIRKAALCSYRIIKYRPFKISAKNSITGSLHRINDNIKINEEVAYYLIVGAIAGLMKKKIPDYYESTSLEYKKRLIYAFSEHDINKESMILIAESLSEGLQLMT